MLPLHNQLLGGGDRKIRDSRSAWVTRYPVTHKNKPHKNREHKLNVSSQLFPILCQKCVFFSFSPKQEHPRPYIKASHNSTSLLDKTPIKINHSFCFQHSPATGRTPSFILLMNVRVWELLHKPFRSRSQLNRAGLLNEHTKTDRSDSGAVNYIFDLFLGPTL